MPALQWSVPAGSLNPCAVRLHGTDEPFFALAAAGAVPGGQAQLMQGSNCLAHLTDAPGQLGTDEVHVVLGHAVENH